MITKVTTSQMRCFKACRKRYELEYIEGLKPIEEPKPLAIGSMYHAGLELLLQGAQLGDAIDAVIYDQELTDASVSQLQTALVNMGYMNSTVECDTTVNNKKRRIDVRYNVTLGEPHYIDSIVYNIPDDTLRHLILADSASFVLKRGDLFDRTQLDLERQGITNRLREHGYYAFNKEYITFTADTAEGQKDVVLTLNTMPPYQNSEMVYYDHHEPFFVRSVTYVTNYDPLVMHGRETYRAQDTTEYRGINILYDDKYIRPSVIEECNFVIPGKLYSSSDIDRTYRALGRLGVLKFINVEVVPVVSAQDMFEAVTARQGEADFIFKAAAVADYTPADYSDDKVKKKDGDLSIPLKRTQDILQHLGDHRQPGQVICGFSMETRDMLENSTAKLEKKHVDMICANNLKVAGAGFGVDTNVLTLITREGAEELPLLSKEEAANRVIDRAVQIMGQRKGEGE